MGSASRSWRRDLSVLFAVQFVGIVASPGSGGNPHTTDEYYELDSMRPSMEVLLALVIDWCGVTAG